MYSMFSGDMRTCPLCIMLCYQIALVRAVNKILWIQNDLFARYHSSDGEEFADEMSASQ
jgi:hypothetical protein